MEISLLEKFRNQLATWIETRLSSQRLPFQRLELCPRTLTELGRLTPDMILWINRDSQLAGSMILLPVTIDNQTLSEGTALAKALGLGHFTTWAAREVAIWEVTAEAPEKLQSFFLPAANRVIPQDFQDTLDDLLDHLKVITVTKAPASTDFPTHYFANLCLRNLQELTPGLTNSARLTAGQTAADEWVEQAPREKAWLSLWRILFLLWQGRLPPGLQPERLENAIRYALSDLTDGPLEWLSPRESEPPLPDDDAVRLYHLAGRLRQLGWPRNSEEAKSLAWILLTEAAHRFGVGKLSLPWLSDDIDIRVACHPSEPTDACTIIAPRAYLAGWILHSELSGSTEKTVCAESLQALGKTQQWTKSLASFTSTRTPDRREREANLINLRQAWPNRRFDLPKNAPAWLWDILFLAGLTSGEFSVILPEGWHLTPGIGILWETLKERWQLAGIALLDNNSQALCFVRQSQNASSCKVHRDSRITIEIPTALREAQEPGTTQVWLKGDLSIVDIVIERMSCGFGDHWPEEREQLRDGAALFLQTDLGSYLWNLCSNNAPSPAKHEVLEAILSYGVPTPYDEILAELAIAMAHTSTENLDAENLNCEFSTLFGESPAIDQDPTALRSGEKKAKRKLRVSTEDIAARVFCDGLPRFPDHYLMDYYQPKLASYALHGPMKIVEAFFDRVSLQTIDQEHRIEVAGGIIAEALLLTSYNAQGMVSLPEDEQLLEQLVRRYRTDLQNLWDKLIRECRRVTPQRQSAIKLARKIWNEKSLPPSEA